MRIGTGIAGGDNHKKRRSYEQDQANTLWCSRLRVGQGKEFVLCR